VHVLFKVRFVKYVNERIVVCDGAVTRVSVMR